MKYDMRICKCGTIHMIDNDKLDVALKHNKNLLLICAECGHAKLIGADIEPSWFEPDRDCYNMYAFEFSPNKDKTISPVDFDSKKEYKGIEEIIYSHGYKVPMNSGMYATDYNFGRFSDRWYPDFYKIQRKDITVKEIMEFIDKYNEDRTTVNMNRFINETPEDVLEVISGYLIDGFDWTGTKWERK